MLYSKILLPIFFVIQFYTLEIHAQQKLITGYMLYMYDISHYTTMKTDLCVAYHLEKNKLSLYQLNNELCTSDYHKLTDQIIYVIHHIQSWIINYMISSCQARQDDDIWIQLNDVIIDGQSYQYFALSDKARQQCTYDACYLMPYDGSEDIYFLDRTQFEKALHSTSEKPEINRLVQSNLSGSSAQQNSCNIQTHAPFNNQAKYQINPSHQKTNPHVIQQSLSNKNGLENIDKQNQDCNKAVNHQNWQSIHKYEQYLDQKHPGLADQIAQDRQELAQAHQNILKIHKHENPSRIDRWFGKKPVMVDEYTHEQVKDAQIIIKHAEHNPHKHKKEVIFQANKIIQTMIQSQIKNEHNTQNTNNNTTTKQNKNINTKPEDTQNSEHKDKNNPQATSENKNEESKNNTQKSEKNNDLKITKTDSKNNNQNEQHKISVKKSLDQIKREHTQTLNDFSQNLYQNYQYQKYHKSYNKHDAHAYTNNHQMSDNPHAFLQNQYQNKYEDLRNNNHKDINFKNSNQTTPAQSAWEQLGNDFYKASQQAAEEQKQINEIQRQIAEQEYWLARKMEMISLDYYNYSYEKSEQDFIDIIKHKLLLRTKQDIYHKMGSFSYDYWISNKPQELRSLIKIHEEKAQQLDKKIKQDYQDWKQQSLQEIEKKEKQRKLEEHNKKRKLIQAIIDKKNEEARLLVTYGYIFKASNQISQKLEQTKTKLAETITESKKPLSIYSYWFNNKRYQYEQEIKKLQETEISIHHEIQREEQAWQIQSLSEIYALQNQEASQHTSLDEPDEKGSLSKKLIESFTVYKNSFDTWIKSDQDTYIDSKDLTTYINPDDQENTSKTYVKDSPHRYNIPQSITQSIRENIIDNDNTYTHKISYDQIKMINDMLQSLEYAQNSTIVEYAQTGLKSFQHARHAQNDEEYKHYMHQFHLAHQAIKKGTCHNQTRSTKSLITTDIQTLTEQYNEILTDQELHWHHACINQRLQALSLSEKQLQSKKLILQEQVMSSQARAFLIAHHLNYAVFDTMNATSFQHCLTQENLDIIEDSVDFALQHHNNRSIQEYMQETCNLAIAAQQLNQQAKVKEAAALTDVNKFFAAYGRMLADDDGSAELESLKIAAKGSYKATSRVLYKWSKFLYHFGTDPQTTLENIGKDCYALGQCINYAAAELYEHSQLAYEIDNLIDMFEGIHDLCTKGHVTPRERLSEIRKKRNEQALERGITKVINASYNVITTMKEKPAEDIIADVVECSIDNLIYNKIAHGLIKLMQSTGSVLIAVGNEICESIPKKLHDSPIQYMQTSTGEIIAVAEKTGQDITKVIAQQKTLNQATKIQKLQEKTNSINNKVCKLTKGNPKKIADLHKSMKSHLRSDIIVDIERLKTITDIDQINAYKKYTHNFHPEGIAKLKPEEILHLNLCEWLEPQARKINERIKASGGLKIIEVKDGIECITEIYELDLFHSLLGDLKPGSIRSHTSGGHLMIPELKAALLDIADIKHVGNGFFDMGIQYAGKEIPKYIDKTFFPLGTSVEEAVEMIEESIKNFTKITNETPVGRINQQIYKIEHGNYLFKLHIEENRNIFYPFID